MAVATIRDLPSPWRQKLLPASFDGQLFMFHVESGSREGGRRIITHEFPKKDYPYSEDMGRKATEFSVRGYIVQFPYNAGLALYQQDYTVARDALQQRLDSGGPGTLQLPMMHPLTVVCSRYRMTEEEKLGGYVVFDMTFVELGIPPFKPVVNAADALEQASIDLKNTVTILLTPAAAQKLPPIAGGGLPSGTTGLAGGRPFALPGGQRVQGRR